MSSPFAVAYGQNFEDVVLHRALRDVERGFYVEVGANDPTEMSISRAFYDAGWHGIEVEPVPQLAEQFAAARPRDVVVHAAVTAADVETVDLHWFVGTGLSTLDDSVSARHESSGRETTVVPVPARSLQSILDEHASETIHFMVVDTEGTEADVLSSVDLSRWRPWVLVIEATQPLSTVASHEAWEADLLAAGYRFCLFDGISRFYVAEEHADRLGPALGYPATVLDGYTPLHWHRREQVFAETLAELDRTEQVNTQLREQLVRWRGSVLARWAAATAGGGGGGAPTHEVVRLREELDAHRATLSWRVTAPLRTVQRRRLEGRR